MPKKNENKIDKEKFTTVSISKENIEYLKKVKRGMEDSQVKDLVINDALTHIINEYKKVKGEKNIVQNVPIFVAQEEKK